MKLRGLYMVCLGLLLCGVCAAQPALVCLNGGNGSDGPFSPTISTVLDSNVQAVYNFTSMTIGAGITVTCIGSTPITIKVIGAAQIDGTLNASGVAGTSSNNNTPGGAGGVGGPGGRAGGDGGCMAGMPFSSSGAPGAGPGGGGGGMDLMVTFGSAGGGGGGNATAGMPGTDGGMGGAGPGGPAVTPCRAGSGGGGGGCDLDSTTVSTSNDGGGGGGGGGGRLLLFSDTVISVGLVGAILANGGNGGDTLGNGGGGGGGSGGSLELTAPAILIDGVVSAVGGTGGLSLQAGVTLPGGDGGDGCIDLNGDTSGSFNLAAATPAPTTGAFACMITTASPTASVQVTGAAGNTYIAILSGSLTGNPIPLFFNNFMLNLADPIFNLSFPVNNLVPFVTNLSGAVGASVNIVLPNLPGLDLTLFMQAVTLNGATIVGGTNVMTMKIEL